MKKETHTQRGGGELRKLKLLLVVVNGGGGGGESWFYVRADNTQRKPGNQIEVSLLQ